jgi:hypothetical protein
MMILSNEFRGLLRTGACCIKLRKVVLALNVDRDVALRVWSRRNELIDKIFDPFLTPQSLNEHYWTEEIQLQGLQGRQLSFILVHYLLPQLFDLLVFVNRFSTLLFGCCLEVQMQLIYLTDWYFRFLAQLSNLLLV